VDAGGDFDPNLPVHIGRLRLLKLKELFDRVSNTVKELQRGSGTSLTMRVTWRVTRGFTDESSYLKPGGKGEDLR